TILATGFPYKQKQRSANYFALLEKLFVRCADFRRTGSAALDLAYVACGRVDGFFELGLKPWDFAAGELLVKESGGVVSDFSGGHNYVTTGNIIAAKPKVLKDILLTVKENDLTF